jgi:hypothetical protein
MEPCQNKHCPHWTDDDINTNCHGPDWPYDCKKYAEAPAPPQGGVSDSSDLLDAGFLVECRGVTSHFKKKEYAIFRKRELKAAGFNDVEIVPVYKKSS